MHSGITGIVNSKAETFSAIAGSCRSHAPISTRRYWPRSLKSFISTNMITKSTASWRVPFGWHLPIINRKLKQSCATTPADYCTPISVRLGFAGRLVPQVCVLVLDANLGSKKFHFARGSNGNLNQSQVSPNEGRTGAPGSGRLK